MTPSMWQRMRAITASTQEMAAAELRERSETTGATSVIKCCTGEMVTVTGVLASVTLRPKQSLKVLEADLFDGTGTLTLMWLGRRDITGITPGRSVTVTGRIVEEHGRLAMYNPRYSLIAKTES